MIGSQQLRSFTRLWRFCGRRRAAETAGEERNVRWIRDQASGRLVAARACAPWGSRPAAEGGDSSSERDGADVRPEQGRDDHGLERFTPGEREIGVFDSVITDFEKLHPNVQRRQRRAGSTTTRSSPRSAAATPPTWRSPSAPTTPAPSAARAPGSTCSRTSTATTSTSTSSRRRSATTPSTTGTRCAMPLLADVYGLYYNKDMFDAAGHQVAAEDRSPSSTPTRRS